MPVMSDAQKAFALTLVALILGSTGPSVFKLLLAELSNTVIVMYFFLFGGVILLAIPKVYDKVRGTKNVVSAATVSSMNRIIVLTVVAGLAQAAAYSFLTRAIAIQSVTESSLVYRVAPLIAILLAAPILHERIGRPVYLGFAFLFCVTGVLINEDFSKYESGNWLSPFIICAITAAFFTAGNQIIQRYISVKFTMKREFITGWVMVTSGLALVLWNVAADKSFALSSAQQVLGILYLGVGTLGLPNVLKLKAYELLKSVTKLALMDYLIPLFSAVFAYVINHETGFNYWKLAISFVVITIGVILANKSVMKTVR